MNNQQIADKARTLAAQIITLQTKSGWPKAAIEHHAERIIREALTEAAKPLDLECAEGTARCKECDSVLLFSARQLKTGLCHRCGHLKYAEIVKRLSDIFPPAEPSDKVPALLSDESIISKATAERLAAQLQQMNDQPPVKFIIKDAERSPSFQALIDKYL